jgi:hypothetical protein
MDSQRLTKKRSPGSASKGRTERFRNGIQDTTNSLNDVFRFIVRKSVIARGGAPVDIAAKSTEVALLPLTA